MARPIPADRFTKLIDVATQTFVARGYRLTQISDVADALGVAKGTIYGYVESKEALFDAALRFADDLSSAPATADLPLPTPTPGSTVAFVRDRLTRETQDLALVQALTDTDVGDGSAEFRWILRDLYRRLWRNRRTLKLIDRCAVDFPDLALAWFEHGRWGLVDAMAAYLDIRIAGGCLRLVPDSALAARMILETIALWAIHMPWDPAPRVYDNDQVEDAVVDLLVSAYMKEETS